MSAGAVSMCHHRVDVKSGSKATPFRWATNFEIHSSTFHRKPYGGFKNVKLSSQSVARPSCFTVRCRRAGFQGTTCLPGEHGSKSNSTPIASKNSEGVYHSVCEGISLGSR